MPDDPTSPKEPTLFAEASLVSHSPKRESSKLKTTPDISGRKCLELSGNSGPLGCVEKMLLGSLDWAWTKYSLTWKTKATPQGRLIFQLARQAHPTSVNDYGLLHTPTAKANQTSPSMVERGHGNWVSNLWPTPTAVTKEENYEVWLARMQRKTDPKSNTKTKPSDLGIAVRMWPTPRVSMANGPSKKEIQEGNPKRRLETEVHLWPTPRATPRMAYHESPTKSQIEGTHGWNLNAAVTDSLADDPARLWPTPTVQDSNKATKKWREDHQNNLTAAVFNPEKINQTKNPKTIGHLNPKWVAWLMGYPIEYLSCVPWETRSSRKSRKE
tara:strand:- start:3350 stop:4330 length:981 start_codon:yes stop_codon:yes gene_type:complete